MYMYVYLKKQRTHKTQNLSLLTTNKQKKLPYCTNTSISFTLKTLERKETKHIYCKDHWQIFNLDINHKWFINNSTLNCFHVVKSTNFYQIPWLEEKEMGKKRMRSMLRQSRPRYIMIYLYLFWQYHRSFISIEIETTRKNNLPKQNFKHLQNICLKF